MKERKRIIQIIYHVLMISFSILMVYPLLWMISSSFKHTDDIMITADQLIPLNPTMQNYINGWKGFSRTTYATFFKNSFILSGVRVVGTVVSCSLAAYGFARIKFVGRKLWFGIMIATMCLPGMALQIPRYMMFSNMGWVGTWNPLLIPCWFANSTFDIFLLMQFMRNIPKEMDEAAEIDGCGKFRLYTDIMLPLVKPAIASVAILTFIGAWGDYYSSLIYLNKPKFYPVAYALKLYSDEVGTNYGPMLAMSVLSIVPVLILFFIFQKQLIDGISTDGLKG